MYSHHTRIDYRRLPGPQNVQRRATWVPTRHQHRGCPQQRIILLQPCVWLRAAIHRRRGRQAVYNWQSSGSDSREVGWWKHCCMRPLNHTRKVADGNMIIVHETKPFFISEVRWTSGFSPTWWGDIDRKIHIFNRERGPPQKKCWRMTWNEMARKPKSPHNYYYS